MIVANCCYVVVRPIRLKFPQKSELVAMAVFLYSFPNCFHSFLSLEDIVFSDDVAYDSICQISGNYLSSVGTVLKSPLPNGSRNW